MYNWAMEIWGWSSQDFVWSSLKWLGVMYGAWNIHQEIMLWRMRRTARINMRRM